MLWIYLSLQGWPSAGRLCRLSDRNSFQTGGALYPGQRPSTAGDSCCDGELCSASSSVSARGTETDKR